MAAHTAQIVRTLQVRTRDSRKSIALVHGHGPPWTARVVHSWTALFPQLRQGFGRSFYGWTADRGPPVVQAVQTARHDAGGYPMQPCSLVS
jgi:hypothetical protein